MTKAMTILGTSALFAMLAACTQSTGDEGTPGAETLETAASITNNGWTATAYPPATPVIGGTPDYGDLWSKASFSGTGTRKMGVCELQMTATPCTTVNDCSSSPASLPTGGSRYCTNYDNAGQKYCAFRPGSQTSYCAGSPALGGTAVSAGTYTTPRRIALDNTSYVSMACFEGCTASDPSVSSAGFKQCRTDENQYVGDKYADYCVDMDCDGFLDYCSGPSGKFPYPG